jgi:hypothetical protein
MGWLTKIDPQLVSEARDAAPNNDAVFLRIDGSLPEEVRTRCTALAPIRLRCTTTVPVEQAERSTAIDVETGN